MREIENFPGYLVTEDGRVFSRRSHAGYISDKKIKELKQEFVRGYKRVSLSVNGKVKRVFVHRLVAKTYDKDGMLKGKIVRHLDGVKTNNHISNLSWGTHKENEIDKISHGTKRFGERINTAKFEEWEVMKIIAMNRDGKKASEIHKEFDFVDISSIYNIISGKSWRHLCR